MVHRRSRSSLEIGRHRLSHEISGLSTAGGGVDWLHMRLDDRPKYYRHLPWRDWRKA
jgi:hypothetical protein